METLPCTLPKFEGCKGCNFFRVGNRTCIVLIHTSESCTFAPWLFSLSIFQRKITEIDRACYSSEVVRLEPYPPQFLKFGHVSPAPLQTMIEKNKIMILCSICTLIFVSGGKGGCRACHMHLCQLRSPRGGRLDGTSACHSEGSIFGPEKVRRPCGVVGIGRRS